MKIDRYKPRHWFLLTLQGAYSLLAIAVRPFLRKPATPIVMLYGHQLSGNLKALYSEWQRSKTHRLDLYFLSLDPDYSTELRRQGVQVLQCNRLRDMLKLARAAAMISDHGLHLMTPLLRGTDIRFIDVWHGIPFKGFVPDDFKLQHRYDEVWVSSPLLKSLYETRFGFQPRQIKALGYARADPLFRAGNGKADRCAAFCNMAALPPDRKIVLYAPTWKQDDEGREMFPFGETGQAFIGRLGEQCAAGNATLVVRSHLNARLPAGSIDNVLYCPQIEFPDTEALLLASDILICDWSSIAFDFLALNRPTLFLDVPPPFQHGFSLGPEYRFGCIVDTTDALISRLRDWLAAPHSYLDSYGARHREVTEAVYANSVDGAAAIRQLQRLDALLHNA